MFPSVSSCASTKKKSRPSTNMAAVGHLWFFWLSHLLRNYLTDSNETCLLCSPHAICASTEKNRVRRHIWPFGSRLGLKWKFPLTGLLSHLFQDHWSDFFYILVRMFPSMSSFASTKKSDLSKNMTAAGNLWFFLLLHLLRNYWVESNKTCLLG